MKEARAAMPVFTTASGEVCKLTDSGWFAYYEHNIYMGGFPSKEQAIKYAMARTTKLPLVLKVGAL